MDDVDKALIKVPIAKGKKGSIGPKYGSSQMGGSQPQELVFHHVTKQDRFLRSVVIYHGQAVDGLEFVYDNSSTQLFGKRGAPGSGSEFALDVRRGELLTGFFIRAGFWIDGVEILTSLGRRSGVYGNMKGGKG